MIDTNLEQTVRMAAMFATADESDLRAIKQLIDDKQKELAGLKELYLIFESKVRRNGTSKPKQALAVFDPKPDQVEDWTPTPPSVEKNDWKPFTKAAEDLDLPDPTTGQKPPRKGRVRNDEAWSSVAARPLPKKPGQIGRPRKVVPPPEPQQPVKENPLPSISSAMVQKDDAELTTIIKNTIRANGPMPMDLISRRTQIPMSMLGTLMQNTSVFVYTAIGWGLRENHR